MPPGHQGAGGGVGMPRPPARPGTLAKVCFVLISLTFAALGVLALLTEVVPERSTRFGMAPALFGTDAQGMGVVSLLLAGVPLLALLRNRRQAVVAGTVLGLALLTFIFTWIFG